MHDRWISMFGIESLSGNLHAAAIVGLVFSEALVLYAGYGVATGALASVVVNAIRGE
ncbi:hypothetical protein SAMN05444342_3336 [Haladaptatus paucihalophilus DX253]|uniref:Uncharacterized protein n=2 Tax=Haladaptatus paucihalophilus DX253 TaxID=797209 RepID=A0A1M6YWV2_HALPU|nr:hypothetical protein SAMN05444342_3336 [Haladaptatus paucihalophilus DX253]